MGSDFYHFQLNWGGVCVCVCVCVCACAGDGIWVLETVIQQTLLAVKHAVFMPLLSKARIKTVSLSSLC